MNEQYYNPKENNYVEFLVSGHKGGLPSPLLSSSADSLPASDKRKMTDSALAKRRIWCLERALSTQMSAWVPVSAPLPSNQTPFHKSLSPQFFLSIWSENALAAWIASVSSSLSLNEYALGKIDLKLQNRCKLWLAKANQHLVVPQPQSPVQEWAFDRWRCNWGKSLDSYMKCRNKSALSAPWMWMRRHEALFVVIIVQSWKKPA